MKSAKITLLSIVSVVGLLLASHLPANAKTPTGNKCQKCINDAKEAAGCTAKDKKDPEWKKQECDKAMLQAKLKCESECPD